VTLAADRLNYGGQTQIMRSGAAADAPAGAAAAVDITETAPCGLTTMGWSYTSRVAGESRAQKADKAAGEAAAAVGAALAATEAAAEEAPGTEEGEEMTGGGAEAFTLTEAAAVASAISIKTRGPFEKCSFSRVFS
jgi:hypothetical protein